MWFLPPCTLFMLLAIRGLIVARKYVLTLILSYLYIDVVTLYDTLGITKLKFNSFNVNKTLTYAKKTPGISIHMVDKYNIIKSLITASNHVNT